MFTRKILGVVSACALCAGVGVVALRAAEPPKATTPKAVQPNAVDQKVVTLEGRIVDVECFMTGKYSATDHTKCAADCIRAGVPAALETSSGLVLIGEGTKSPATDLAPFALTRAKITGRLYKKSGLQYIDMTKVEKSNEPSHASAKPHKQALPKHAAKARS